MVPDSYFTYENHSFRMTTYALLAVPANGRWPAALWGSHVAMCLTY